MANKSSTSSCMAVLIVMLVVASHLPRVITSLRFGIGRSGCALAPKAATNKVLLFSARGGALFSSSDAEVAKSAALKEKDNVADGEDYDDDFVPPHRWTCPVNLQGENVCETTGITLSRYMREMARANPELEDIESIFTSLQTATKTISHLVRQSSLTGQLGLVGNVNVQGEDQKKLDVLTNNVLKESLEWSGHMGTLASEEEDTPVPILTDVRDNAVFSNDILIDELSSGQYVAVFDPLDGSSNVDASIPTGMHVVENY